MRVFLRILQESIKGFFYDKCYLHGSTLTFYSLLSIVPIFAVAFGFAKGFGFEANLEQELYHRFSDYPDVINYLLTFVESLLSQVHSEHIAGVGALFLFLFVISLFWTIEGAMNVIWKVKRARPFLRMLTDYTAMLLITPFFYIIASSLSVIVTSQVYELITNNDVLAPVSSYAHLMYRAITLILIWTLFAILYLVMPNTRVRMIPTISAAIFAGTLYYMIQQILISFQIGVSQYNAVYGSFAALPLFLFYLQLSWFLVLFGGEIAYHIEQLAPVLFSDARLTTITKQQLTVHLYRLIVERFRANELPFTLRELSAQTVVPKDLVADALEPLVKSNILTSYISVKKQLHYQPMRDPSQTLLIDLQTAANPSCHQQIEVASSTALEKSLAVAEQFNAQVFSLNFNFKEDF